MQIQKAANKIMKAIEVIAMNFLLKRGYQVTLPMIYFSSGNNKVFGSASYWKGKK